MSQTDQQRIVNILNDLYRNIGGPVPTVAVAVRYGFSDRHMRRMLNTLIDTGAVKRVGKCKGWLPAAC